VSRWRVGRASRSGELAGEGGLVGGGVVGRVPVVNSGLEMTHRQGGGAEPVAEPHLCYGPATVGARPSTLTPVLVRPNPTSRPGGWPAAARSSSTRHPRSVLAVVTGPLPARANERTARASWRASLPGSFEPLRSTSGRRRARASHTQCRCWPFRRPWERSQAVARYIMQAPNTVRSWRARATWAGRRRVPREGGAKGTAVAIDMYRSFGTPSKQVWARES